MNKLILLLPILTVPGFGQPAAPNPSNPISTSLRNLYMGNRNNIVRTAEKMPEENYGMRPGAQTEVRTFGQQVAHVATYNFLWCSQAKGEKNPSPGDLEKLTSKADIMKYLKDSFAYVHKAVATINDANLVGTVRSPFGEGWVSRLGLATAVSSHGYDHYGQMVVYLRMNGIVPPASR